METVIDQDAAKMLAACLNDPEGKSSEEGRKEYVRITWTDRKDPPMRNCFYAFGEWQFHEGLKKFGLEEGFKDGTVRICHAGSGLYGTKEGLDEYFQALRERTAADRAQIREKCTPQDVYEVEFSSTTTQTAQVITNTCTTGTETFGPWTGWSSGSGRMPSTKSAGGATPV